MNDPNLANNGDAIGLVTVLVVDDQRLVREGIASLLEIQAGISVVGEAVNGQEAVEKALLLRPDVILMDVRMPVMDGLEAVRSIRAMKKADSRTVPIVAMTANAFQEDVDASLKAGMNAHLAKPIEPDVLFQTLERYFRRQTD